MAKLILILLAALVLEAVGVVYLSNGVRQITQQVGESASFSLTTVGRYLRFAFTNGPFWLGLLLETIFFVLLLVLLNGWDVSLIWPLTSLGFVITTLAAKFIRHEDVNTVRWGGVLLIVAGAALVAYSEKLKSPEPPPKPQIDTHGHS